MKLIQPDVILLEQGKGIQGIYDAIAQAAATCYKSEAKTGKEAKNFIENSLIARGHFAMLEFGTVYLDYPESEDYVKYHENPYSRIRLQHTGTFAVTTNYRVLVENGWLDDLKYLCKPTEYHAKRYTALFTLSIGIGREFTRHRVFSFAQESTRYCNYSKDRFGGEVTFIEPTWFKNLSPECREEFKAGLCEFEEFYFRLLDNWENRVPDRRFRSNFRGNPLTPQQAREALPLATKSDLCMCGFEEDWRHFFDLRYKGVTGAPHPDARHLAARLYKLFETKGVLLDL